MTDKERILMCLVTAIFRRSLYDSESISQWKASQPGIIGGINPLIPGDLVIASTAIDPNEFMVGFVERVCADHVVIREIGGDRLCRYYNEYFYRIDKKILGNEILEGTQYITYRKVLKAFSKSDHSYMIRFHSISFDKNMCTVSARKCFSDETLYTVSFKYNKKTTVKSIVEILNKEGEKVNKKSNK